MSRPCLFVPSSCLSLSCHRIHVDNSPIRFEAHPPERKRRPQSVVVACGCCCCCCCCLHTLGGVIGAAVAPAFGRRAYPSKYRLLVEEYDYEVSHGYAAGES